VACYGYYGAREGRRTRSVYIKCERPMSKGILLITVILFFPVPGLAAFSEAHKAYELRDHSTLAKEFWPLRSDLERAVDSCTRSVHRDDPDFDAYNEGSSVILLGATPDSRSKFHKCMSQKGYPLMKPKS
jgi:hypothetical protein